VNTEFIYPQYIELDTVYVIEKKVDWYAELLDKARLEALEEAKNDIANGNIYLRSYGLIVLSVDISEIDSIASKYGFKYILAGCIRPLGADTYREEVMKYLNERNGEGWWEKFLYECKKLEENKYKE
jgi:hypothetical protein